MKVYKFKAVDGDIDYTKLEYSLYGRMTKGRYKILDRYVRKNNFHTHCGHEWDCCGCMCKQTMDLKKVDNSWVLSAVQHYNF